MRKEIAAAAILYYPTEDMITNINTYLPYVSRLVLVDNSEIPDMSLYTQLQKEQKIILISNNENRGIAAALNQAVSLASDKGFEWILTMDQDSWFERDMIERYFSDFDNLPSKESVAAIGPLFENKPQKDIPSQTRPVNSLITSGTLLNIAIFKKIGGYNEALFIDEVDHEYCYRARLQGFSIFQLLHIYLHHSLGRSETVTTVLGKKNILKTLHSPIRLYYIVRNSCYIISLYKKSFPEEIRIKRKDMLVRIKNNILYGNNKISTIKYVIRGFMDFKRKKFGKYN